MDGSRDEPVGEGSKNDVGGSSQGDRTSENEEPGESTINIAKALAELGLQSVNNKVISEIAQDYVEGDKVTETYHVNIFGRDIPRHLRKILDKSGIAGSRQDGNGTVFQGDFVSWRKDADDHQVCLLLSVAVLHGASFVAIWDAACALKKKFDIGLAREIGNAESYGTASIPELLREVGAARLYVDEADEGCSQDHIVFLHTEHRDKVLIDAWQQNAALRHILPSWIAELGLHQSHDVRVRAAEAAGVLLGCDQQAVINEIILKWTAKGQSKRHRWMAARAFAVNVRYVEARRKGFLLLNRIAEGEYGAGTASAAALCLGLGIHEVDFEASLRLTRVLCNNSEFQDGALIIGLCKLDEEIQKNTKLLTEALIIMAPWADWMSAVEVKSTTDVLSEHALRHGTFGNVGSSKFFLNVALEIPESQGSAAESAKSEMLAFLLARLLILENDAAHLQANDRVTKLAARNAEFGKASARIVLKLIELPSTRKIGLEVFRSWLRQAREGDLLEGAVVIFRECQKIGGNGYKDLNNHLKSWQGDRQLFGAVQRMLES